MKLYYHINLTGEHDDADLLSVGLVNNYGMSAYFEANDYDERKLDKDAAGIVDDFLGRPGMEDLIVSRPKSKGFICSGRRVKEHVNGLLSDAGEVALISFDTPEQTLAMLRLLDWNNFAKHLHLINLDHDLPQEQFAMFREEAPQLPETNALRYALFYQTLSEGYGSES